LLELIQHDIIPLNIVDIILLVCVAIEGIQRMTTYTNLCTNFHILSSCDIEVQ